MIYIGNDASDHCRESCWASLSVDILPLATLVLAYSYQRRPKTWQPTCQRMKSSQHIQAERLEITRQPVAGGSSKGPKRTGEDEARE